MADETPHESLPGLLVKQKLISSRAFSLWLNDLNTPGGEILFGGVDTGKYQGDLISVPFVERVRGLVIDFSVVLEKVDMTKDKGEAVALPSKSSRVFALLDSGSSQTILPDDMVDEIYKKLGANLSNPGMPTVNCSLIKGKTTLDFHFEEELKIKVPLSQLIFPVENAVQCPLWGVAKSSLPPFNTIILGSSFLSSAYVVYDMDNREASLAQAKWDPKTSNVLQITSGGHAVPGIAKTWKGLPAAGKTINHWAYLGCANETAPRTLNEGGYVAANMTIETCQAYCKKLNFRLSGLEFAEECFCGNVLSNGGAVGGLGCDMPCQGDAEEICGGSDHLSIFEDTAYIPVVNPPIINGYGYFGCYQELPDGRLLSGPGTAGPNMTAQTCTSFCSKQGRGLTWAGLEFGRECFCASGLPSSASPAPETACNMVCSGNEKEYCGGSRIISMYKYLDSA